MTTINVGSAYAIYGIRYDQFVSGVQAIETGYKRLIDLSRTPIQFPEVKPPPALPDQFKPTGGGRQASAAKESQQLADSQVRAARAAGDYAKALAIVDKELQQTSKDTVRYNNLLAQQATLQRQQASAAGPGGGRLSGMFGATTKAFGAIGVGLGVQQIVQGTAELAQLGTQVTRVTQSFEQLATKSGQSGAVLLAALRSASGGEIDDLNLKLAANRANLLGVADSADEFARLMAIARSRAQAMGTTTSDAFNDLVTGLGRGSPLILDNLGITVKLGEANEAYAKTLGKTAAQLTDTEKKQALINAVLAQSADQTAASSDSFAKLGTSVTNLQQSFAVLVASGLKPAAESFAILFDVAARGVAGLSGAAGKQFADEFLATSPAIKAAAESLKDYRAASNETRQANIRQAATVERARVAFEQHAREVADLAVREQQSGLNLGAAERLKALEQEAIQLQQLSAGLNTLIPQRDRDAQAAQAQALAASDAAKAKGEELEKTIASQRETAALADAQAQLDADSKAAADGLLAAGDQAAALAAKYFISADAAQFLIDKQKALAGPRVDPKREDSQFRPGELQGQAGDLRAQFLADQRAAAQAAYTARTAQQFALASPAERLKLEQQALARLKPGTAEYINQQTKVLQLQRQIAEQSDKRGTKIASTARKAVETEQRSLQKIQDDYADHYQRLTQMSDDYNLNRSRNEEDFQISQRRLLAEGRIKEAQLAKEDFDREQRRKREDFDRATGKSVADFAREHGGTAAVGPVPAAMIAAGRAAPVVPAAAAALAAAGQPSTAQPTVIKVDIPISVTMDGQQIATITGPLITQPLLDDLALQIGITTAGRPVGGQQTAFREIG